MGGALSIAPRAAGTAAGDIAALREELVAVSHWAFARGLVAGVSGNNSVRLPGADAMLIKVTGVCQGDMTADDTVEVGFDGTVAEPDRRPSKEWRWHAAIYRANPEVGGIVHVHPPYAVAWAVANRTPRLVHTAARGMLKEIGLIGLAPSGSEELAAMVADAFADPALRVALMREHGIVAVGADLREAFYRADYVEDTAKVALLAAEVQALPPGGGVRLAEDEEA